MIYKLQFQIVEGVNLPFIALNEPPSAYIGFTYKQKFLITDIKKRNKNPKWESLFEIEVSEQQLKKCLKLIVYNSNKTDVDQILGYCNIQLYQLCTKKQTISEFYLNNRYSKIIIKHRNKNNKSQPINYSNQNGINFHVIDIIQKDSQNGILTINYAENKKIIRKIDNIIDEKNFVFKFTPNIFSLEFQYTSIHLNTQVKFNKVIFDMSNIQKNLGNFKKIKFVNSQLQLQVKLIIAISILSNTFKSQSYNYIVPQIVNIQTKKSFILRIVSYLNEIILSNYKDKVNQKLCYIQNGYLLIQYFQNKNEKDYENKKILNKPQYETILNMSQLNWQEKDKILTAVMKFAQKKFSFLLNSLNLQIKFTLTNKQYPQQNQFSGKILELNDKKQKFKISVKKISLKNCYLFEILNNSQFMMILKDSESNLKISATCANKDYFWEGHFDTIITQKSKYNLQFMLIDTTINFGQDRLNQFENSLILTAKINCIDFKEFGTIDIQSISYSEQFMKFLKKNVLTNPSSTKYVNKMITEKELRIRIQYMTKQIIQNKQFILTLFNIKFVSTSSLIPKRSISISIGGNSFIFKQKQTNNYLLIDNRNIYIRNLKDVVELLVYEQRGGKSCVVFSKYELIEQFFQIVNRKKSKLQIKMSSQQKINIYYSIEMVDTIQKTKQPISTTKISYLNSCNYKISLLTLNINSNYQYLNIQAENKFKKYRSSNYYLQNYLIRLNKQQNFFLQFKNKQQSSHIVFFTVIIHKQKNQIQILNGYVNLYTCATNKRTVQKCITLLKNEKSKQTKDFLIIKIQFFETGLIRQIESDKILKMDIKYILPLNSFENLLRQGYKYFLTIRVKQKVSVFQLEYSKQKILDVVNLSLDKQNLNLTNVNDIKYAQYLIANKKVQIPIYQKNYQVLFQIYYISKSFKIQTLDFLQISSEKFFKLASATKSILQIIEQTKRKYFQTIRFECSSSIQNYIRYNLSTMLMYQMKNTIYLIYSPTLQNTSNQKINRVYKKFEEGIPIQFMPKGIVKNTINFVDNLDKQNILLGTQFSISTMENSNTLNLLSNNKLLICRQFKNKINKNTVDYQLKIKKNYELAFNSDNFFQQKMQKTMLLAKFNIKSNKSFEHLLKLSNNGIEKSMIKYQLQVISNRFSQNPQGELVIQSADFFMPKASEFKGISLEIVLSMINYDELKICKLENQDYIMEQIKNLNIIHNEKINLNNINNFLKKKLMVKTNNFKNSLLVLIKNFDKKSIIGYQILQLSELKLQNLSNQGFKQEIIIDLFKSNNIFKAFLKLSGNYTTTTLLKKQIGEKSIKYRINLNNEIEYIYTSHQMINYLNDFQTQKLNAKPLQYKKIEQLKITINQPQIIKFNTILSSVQFWIICKNNLSIKVQNTYYKIYYQKQKQTIIQFIHPFTKILNQNSIQKLKIQYKDPDNKLKVFIADKIRTNEKNQIQRFIFQNYANLMVQSKLFSTKSLSKQFIISLKLHRIVKIQKIDQTIKQSNIKIISLTSSPKDQILTKKFKLKIFHNDQIKFSSQINSIGQFVQIKPIIFGSSLNFNHINFSLMIDNYYNSLENKNDQQQDWIKQMIINKGQLCIPQLLINNQQYYFCTPLLPFKNNNIGIGSSFEKLLQRKNIYLLGNFEIQQRCWGNIKIKVEKIRGIDLKRKQKCLIGIRLIFIKQLQKNKFEIERFQSDYQQKSEIIQFAENQFSCQIFDEKNYTYYIKIQIRGFSSFNQFLIVQKRIDITDILHQDLQIKSIKKIQIKQQQSSIISKLFQFDLLIQKSYNIQSNQPNIQLVNQNKIDIVDFRQKEDIEFIQILCMSGNVQQLIESLEQIKQSFIYLDKPRFNLIKVLTIFFKVYNHNIEISKIILMCIEIYIAKDSKSSVQIIQLNIYQMLKQSLEISQNRILQKKMEENIADLVKNRQWNKIQSIVYSMKKNMSYQANQIGLLEIKMDFMLSLLKNFDSLKQIFLKDFKYWKNIVQSNNIKSINEKFSLIIILIYRLSTNVQTNLEIFEFLRINIPNNTQNYLYCLYKQSKQNKTMQSYIKNFFLDSFKTEKQDIKSLLLTFHLFLDQLQETDYQNFKELTIKSNLKNIDDWYKKSMEKEDTIIYKKITVILLIYKDKFNNEDALFKQLLQYTKIKQTTLKAQMKMIVGAFLRKIDNSLVRNQKKTKDKKKDIENRFLISKLNY